MNKEKDQRLSQDRTVASEKEDEIPAERTLVVEISKVTDENTSISVRFVAIDADDSAKAAVLLYDTERQMTAAKKVAEIREICVRKRGVYYPASRNASKMELMMLSVAANYPEGLLLDSIVSELDIERKAAHAYITSENNWTSQYLYLDEKKVKSKESGLSFILKRIRESTQNTERAKKPESTGSET